MDLSTWVPDEVDIEKPSAARAYDAMLGGGHNFASDREFARKAEQVFPGAVPACIANRSFLRRVVQYLAHNGITQFLDIGSGIPTVGNVHEVAQAIDPACRVVYVDNEAVAVAHSERMLEGNENATMVRGELRDPRSVLEAPGTTKLLDLDRPVALLMFAVVHFLPDTNEPIELLERYRDALAPGSHLGLSVGTADERPEEIHGLERLYSSSTNPAVARSTSWITGLFGDFELVEPGAVYAPEWRPDSDEVVHPEDYIFFGGLARKP